MRLLLILALACTTSQAQDPCGAYKTQCNLVISDLKVEVDLLEQKTQILTKQRDDLVKEVSDKPAFPTYVYLLTGLLVGGVVTLYLKGR